MDQFGFGPYRLEARGPRLLRDGVELDVRPQACLALRALVRNTGRYMDYEEMIREAWNGTLVSRHTVAVTVGEVRKALREYGAWITYRPKRGYRWEAPGSQELIRTGWHFWNQRTREGFEKALECFERAARQDASDARAFEGLSLTYLMLLLYSMRPPAEMHAGFLRAHCRAVQLRGMTPALRADRALALHVYEHRLDEAESELLRARREDPSLAMVYVRLAMLYAALSRLDDAVEVLEKGRAADPLYPVLPATEVSIRFLRREYDLAVAIGKQAMELHPLMQLGHAYYAQALEFSGRVEEALAQYRLASVVSSNLAWLRVLEAACLVKSGRAAEGWSIFEELRRTRGSEYLDGYYTTVLFAALGRSDEAFAELERAVRDNSATLGLLDVDPRMDPLRADPRFRAVGQAIWSPAFSPP